MQKITTFLWFNGQAEEAAKFYVSIFKNSKILSANPMTVSFQLEGQTFYALNGGPQYTFTPAISLFVDCETQAEVDQLWGKLTAGGSEEPCGWLKDKYGLSWQVAPDALVDMLGDEDPVKAQRVSAAMMQMGKLDLATLKKAYDGR
jgi:predicted 3-demethylubiquinone-9 3-methyltransferase (glyoxalase superfamily)